MVALPVMTRRLLSLLSLLAALSSACGSGTSYNNACASAKDCASGLICPTVGPMQGRCTKSCTKDEECASLGSKLVCTSDVCTPSNG